MGRWRRARRLLKEGGYFIADETVYQKQNGELVALGEVREVGKSNAGKALTGHAKSAPPTSAYSEGSFVSVNPPGHMGEVIGRVTQSLPNGGVEVELKDGSRHPTAKRFIHSDLKNFNATRLSLDNVIRFPLSLELTVNLGDDQIHIERHVLPPQNAQVHNPHVVDKLAREPAWWAQLAIESSSDAPTYYLQQARSLWAETLSNDPGVHSFYEVYKGMSKIISIKPVNVGGEPLLMVGVFDLREGGMFTSLFLTPATKPLLKIYEYVVPVSFKSVENSIFMDYNPFDGYYCSLNQFIEKNLKK